MRTRVYIAGPMSKGSKIDNFAAALSAMKILIESGYAPLCPQLSFFADPFIEASHDDWVDVDLSWVKVSHAVLRLEGESTGADMEVKTAIQNNIPVFHSLQKLVDFIPETSR